MRAPLAEGYMPGENTNLRSEALTIVFAFILVYIQWGNLHYKFTKPCRFEHRTVNYTYWLFKGDTKQDCDVLPV